MSLVEDIYATFRKIVSVEDRITRLSDDLRRLQTDVSDHAQRISRLEGKFDLLEKSFAARRPKLSR